MDMQNKIALVTAAASGAGRAGAFILAREGAAVAVVDQNEPGVKAVAEEIRKRGGRALALAGDLRNDAFSREIVAATVKEFGRLDSVWNHLGIPGPSVIDDLDGWDLSIDLNLRSQLVTTHAALTHMTAQKSGSILFTASTSGLTGSPWSPTYSAAKAGVIGLGPQSRQAPRQGRHSRQCDLPRRDRHADAAGVRQPAGPARPQRGRSGSADQGGGDAQSDGPRRASGGDRGGRGVSLVRQGVVRDRDRHAGRWRNAGVDAGAELPPLKAM